MNTSMYLLISFANLLPPPEADNPDSVIQTLEPSHLRRNLSLNILFFSMSVQIKTQCNEGGHLKFYHFNLSVLISLIPPPPCTECDYHNSIPTDREAL